MCTAATYNGKNFYFGRTLDYEFSYGEEVVVTPKNFPFDFRFIGKMETHHAIIGIAHVSEGYPLYYDAVNDKGLCMAGLNFVGNASYADVSQERDNVAQYEFMQYVLASCANVREARELTERINLVGTPFSDKLPASSLHWLIADESGALTVESMADGLHIYDNPVGVLTNNPPFDYQMFNLNNYMALSERQPENSFSKDLELKTYSRGMGGLGLPGDLSSQSRFVRVAFTRQKSISENTEESDVSQFFHILGSVEQTRGLCEVEPGRYEITIYTSCCDATRGVYYYTTYDNHQISAVDMHRTDLTSHELVRFPLVTGSHVLWQN